MNCANCGALLGPTDTFCGECGAPRPAPVAATPSPAAGPSATCPNCGAALEPDAQFCGECGTPRLAAALPAVVPSTPTSVAPTVPVAPVGPLACPNCGTALSPGERFCSVCGQPVAGAATAMRPAAPPAAPPARRWLMPAVLALVAVLAGGWLLTSSGLLSGRGTPPSTPAVPAAVPTPSPAAAVGPVLESPTPLPASPPPAIATAAALLVATLTTPPPTAATPAPLAAASSTPEVNRAQEQAVAAILGQLPPAASAVYQNLSGPERADVDPGLQVPAASTIKLPIMIEVFRQAGAGRLSLSQTQTVTRDQVVGGTGVLQNQVGRTLTTLQLLETAVTYSDNVGGNMLTNLVGIDNVNATMRELGFTQTRMVRHFMDLEAQRRGLENLTSAGDMAEMLSRIYRGQLLSASASVEMLRILRLRGQQTDPGLDYLGRYLQPRPTLAHLNGTLTGIRNEAGIVEGNGRAFVLAIYLRGQTNEAGAEEAIARAAASINSIVTSSATR